MKEKLIEEVNTDIRNYDMERADYFELNQKLQDPRYKNAFLDIVTAKGRSSEQAENTIQEIKTRFELLSDNEKISSKEKFDKKFPNGLDTLFDNEYQADIEQAKQEINSDEKAFYEELSRFINSEKEDDSERIKRTQILMDKINENVEHAYQYTERYFENATYNKNISEERRKEFLGKPVAFRKSIFSHIEKMSSAIAGLKDTLAKEAEKSAMQLKLYRIKQFNIEREKAKKQVSLKQVQALTQPKKQKTLASLKI